MCTWQGHPKHSHWSSRSLFSPQSHKEIFIFIKYNKSISCIWHSPTDLWAGCQHRDCTHSGKREVTDKACAVCQKKKKERKPTKKSVPPSCQVKTLELCKVTFFLNRLYILYVNLAFAHVIWYGSCHQSYLDTSSMQYVKWPYVFNIVLKQRNLSVIYVKND